MKKKMLLQSATLVSLLFVVNNFLYGKNTTIRYDDGVVYEGEFEYEKLPEESKYNPIHWIAYKVIGVKEPHGKGKLTFPNGDSYEGGFMHEDMTGEGKYTFADGSYIKGNFVHSRITGKSEIFDKNGNIIPEDQKDSFFNGHEVLKF